MLEAGLLGALIAVVAGFLVRRIAHRRKEDQSESGSAHGRNPND